MRGRTADTGLSGKRSMNRLVIRTTILEQAAASARRVLRASATGTLQAQRAVRSSGRRTVSRTRPPAEHDLNWWRGISCRRPDDPGPRAAAQITPSILGSRLPHGPEPDVDPTSLVRAAADPGATSLAGCRQGRTGPQSEASAQNQAPRSGRHRIRSLELRSDIGGTPRRSRIPFWTQSWPTLALRAADLFTSTGTPDHAA